MPPGDEGNLSFPGHESLLAARPTRRRLLPRRSRPAFAALAPGLIGADGSGRHYEGPAADKPTASRSRSCGRLDPALGMAAPGSGGCGLVATPGVLPAPAKLTAISAAQRHFGPRTCSGGRRARSRHRGRLRTFLLMSRSCGTRPDVPRAEGPRNDRAAGPAAGTPGQPEDLVSGIAWRRRHDGRAVLQGPVPPDPGGSHDDRKRMRAATARDRPGPPGQRRAGARRRADRYLKATAGAQPGPSA
jgi:hypothetical protein